eukprot:1133167-Pyramimonas_sp.AAC.1
MAGGRRRRDGRPLAVLGAAEDERGGRARAMDLRAAVGGDERARAGGRVGWADCARPANARR